MGVGSDDLVEVARTREVRRARSVRVCISRFVECKGMKGMLATRLPRQHATLLKIAPIGGKGVCSIDIIQVSPLGLDKVESH